MTLEQINSRIDRLYDCYVLESIGQNVKPVSKEQFVKDFKENLIGRLLK